MDFAFDGSFAAAVAEDVEQIIEETVATRRYIHMHPEIGFDTHDTEELVKKQLAEAGVEILPAKMGVLGLIKGRDSSRIVALRADMDALCMQEDNDVPYRSLYPNKMHSCGHDGHTAMLLGAAKILSRHRQQLPMDVLLVFQPAEEGPNLGGARIMLADMKEKGLADKIVRMFGQHLFNDYRVGTVGYRFGSYSASTDEFDIKIIGRGGHAGQPDKSIDALSIGAKVINAMESFMSKRIDPFDSAIFSVGIFQSGSAKNVVAETARIAGTIRCQREETRTLILENMERIVKGTCDAFGATSHIDVLHGLPVLVNSDEAVEYARCVAEKVAGSERAFCITHPMMGAEDFAYFAQKIPSAFLVLGSGNPDKGFTCLAHHPRFDFDEEALKTGIAMFCNLAANMR